MHAFPRTGIAAYPSISSKYEDKNYTAGQIIQSQSTLVSDFTSMSFHLRVVVFIKTIMLLSSVHSDNFVYLSVVTHNRSELKIGGRLSR